MQDSPLDALRADLADRYLIGDEIGAGGMATVYLAEDLKHRRKVAVKVLRTDLATTIGVKRFLQEIEMTAGLQHPNLLTLIDSGAVGDLPYYVMPFVEGQSLQEVLQQEGKLPLDRALTIALEVLDALGYAHEHGIVHRDVKPTNILMSGGHAIVADFGIAAAVERATRGRLTQTGASLGSPIYMSPEQAAGEPDLDARSDLYSLGCVIYEMLSGTPPVMEASAQQALTKKLLGSFPPLRSVRSDVPPALDGIVSRALATNKEDRFADVAAFAAALNEIRQSATARPRPKWWGAAAAVVLLLAAGGYWQSRVQAGHALEVARTTGEIERLASIGANGRAFDLAEEVLAIAPRDTTLARLRPMFSDYLTVVTIPAGAAVSRRPYGAADVPLHALGTTPLDSLPEPKWGNGTIRVLRFELPGYRPVEVLPHVFADWAEWRSVPRLDTLRLDRVEDLPEEMVRIPGFPMNDLLHRGSPSMRAGDYYLDRNEVTNADYKEFVDGGGYANPDYWREAFEGDGLTLEEALRQFVDRTGRPGPSTWELGGFPEGQEDYPVGGISWYEASAYARFRGKDLPSSYHWAQGALRHQRETTWLYLPDSNLGGDGPRAVGRGMNAYGVNDVAGNVREWVFNKVGEGRMIRGGAWNDAEFHVGYQVELPPLDRSPQNGVRLMRHFENDSTVQHFRADYARPVYRDYSKESPAPASEVALYLRLFAYDSLALDAQEEELEAAQHYRIQKVTFNAAYGGERMAAYVFLPKDKAPPYQPVIYWPGSGAMTTRAFDHTVWIQNFVDFIPRSGRALILPLYKGSFERDDADFSTVISVPQTTTYYRDIAIQWIKDFRRTVDWLESRPDMDATKVGFYGLSWGSQIAPVVLAAEPRVKAAALDVGGLWWGATPLPELEALNYLPLVKTPVLMLNGRYDMVFPYEAAQVPFFRYLGTPDQDKAHYVFPTSHSVPQEELVPRVLEWFDRYLGVPGG